MISEDTTPNRPAAGAASGEKNPLTEQIDSSPSEPIADVLEEAPATFDELLAGSFLLEGTRAMGFVTPTTVQRRAIPIARRGKDMIVQSRTGSGKTIAYVLPLIERVEALTLEGKPKSEAMSLVIVPTRELAIQVQEVIRTVAGTRYAPTLIIGGADMAAQERALRTDGRIVIGTPGRLLDLLRQRKLNLSRVRFFVLDEADETLSLGFLQDVRTILSRLPDSRQGIFTSATITPRVDMLANSFLENPEFVGVDETYNDLPSVTHHYCEIAGDLMAKPNVLCDLIETMRPTSAIVFCNTKSDTTLVESFLRRRGFDARRLNSDLSQSQRNRVMQKIRRRELRFLIATDIAARGIDIEQIDTVINFAIHETPETYLHRTGRTGRAGRSGKAISLVGPRDFGSFHHLKKIVQIEFHKMPIPTDEDVAEARVAHLHEVLRQSRIELTPRDRAVAQKLAEEQNIVEGETQAKLAEEFIDVVAKLCRHTLEHHVAAEAKSLEEELEAAGEEDGPQERPRENHRQSPKESNRNDRRPSRDDDRRLGRSRDEGRSSGRDSGRDNRSEGDRRPRREDERQADRRPPAQHAHGQHSHGERRSDGRSDRQDNRTARSPQSEERVDISPRKVNEDLSGEDVRLYIGQGTTHGMSEELFRQLATEFGEIDPRDLKTVWFREEYGFADIPGEKVKSVLENLSGIEYNGFALPVEIANTVRRQNGRPQGDRREGDSRPREGQDRRGRGRYQRGDQRR